VLVSGTCTSRHDPGELWYRLRTVRVEDEVQMEEVNFNGVLETLFVESGMKEGYLQSHRMQD
jgi:hypothetical protein